MPLIMEIVCYSAQMQQEWDAFIRTNSRNGGIFHEQTFLGYHPTGRFNDTSLIFRENGTIVGVLPAVDTGEGCIVSHPGSSAGGLVFHRKATTRDVLGMLEGAVAHYRDRGGRSLELRLAEPIFSMPVDGELAYLLWHRGFTLVSRELSACVDLREDGSWLLLGRKKNGTDIRRLIKSGVTVEQREDLAEVYDLIVRNLDKRYGKVPTHTYAELLELKRRYPERINFWLALVDGAPAATVVTFVVNSKAVHDFYIAQDYSFAKYQVMPLLFHTIFGHYGARGFSWFNFGISSRGDWIKWGILEFKERMGGRAVCRDTWMLEDLKNYRSYSAHL